MIPLQPSFTVEVLFILRPRVYYRLPLSHTPFMRNLARRSI